ncbi:MAG: zf-HC2 domain-containing protein [Syntrophomonas sp.]|nr:zf-HC2 domain-containing protein [Syntrophomonas sp.]
MNCQDIKDNIYAYCDGALPSDLQLKLAEHLNECESCRSNYDLTMIENEVLIDTQDIPPLSEAFTARVINTLAAVDIITANPQPIVMVKNTTPGFNKRFWIRGLAVVAAVITLFLYIPDSKDTGNNIQVADNALLQPQKQHEIKPEPVVENEPLLQDKKELPIKLSQATPPRSTGLENQNVTTYSNMNISGAKTPFQENTKIVSDSARNSESTPFSAADSGAMQKESDPAPAILSEPAIPGGMKRSVSLNIGRAIRAENQADNNPYMSLIPQNIPSHFILDRVDSAPNSDTVFNYKSQDGRESFQLQVASCPEKVIATKSVSNSTSLDNCSAINRDLQIGEQNFILTISGNLSTEKLSQLINAIEIEKEESIQEEEPKGPEITADPDQETMIKSEKTKDPEEITKDAEEETETVEEEL